MSEEKEGMIRESEKAKKGDTMSPECLATIKAAKELLGKRCGINLEELLSKVKEKKKTEEGAEEKILLVSAKLEVCPACTTVTEFIAKAITAGKVRVIDIADEEGLKIAETLYKGKKDFAVPAYIIVKDDKYTEGDLRDLMVEVGDE